MNFSKKQNEFCDIPGFDASRGERIVKALQKLWEKIQYLEQRRTSETKPRSETSCSSKDEDLTLTDVQYKLLILQLQYVRSLLRKKFGPDCEVFHSKISDNEQKYELPTSDRNNTRENELHPEIVNKTVSANIHTTSNSVDSVNSAKESGSLEDKSKNAQVISDNQFSRFKHSTEESTAVYQKTVPSGSKPHYHLKLDDVPFILGASSTASHSVVANVQNIIAMMKSHNKALCGPKPNVTRCNIANTGSTGFAEKNSADTVANAHFIDFTEKDFVGENSQDVAKLLVTLSSDLCKLTARQHEIVKRFDAAQIKKHDPSINSAKDTLNQKNKLSYKHGENDGSRKHRSNSESDVKLHAEVKKMPKIKEKDFVKSNVNPKQSACNIRSQPSNLSLMDRRKLLRSLQNFKKHLSEEDISWD